MNQTNLTSCFSSTRQQCSSQTNERILPQTIISESLTQQAIQQEVLAYTTNACA